MNIEEYRFSDSDITQCEVGGNEDYIRFCMHQNPVDELIINKEDAIKIAQHFGLIIET